MDIQNNTATVKKQSSVAGNEEKGETRDIVIKIISLGYSAKSSENDYILEYLMLKSQSELTDWLFLGYKFIAHENVISWQTTISQQQKENYLYAENKCIRVVFYCSKLYIAKSFNQKHKHMFENPVDK